MSGSFSFMGEQTLGGDSISKQVSDNIKTWIDTAFVNNGGYDNISLSEESYDNKTSSQLLPIDDRVYGDGYVYQSYFKNWVWEEGIDSSGGYSPPIVCSGITVGGDFYPKTASGDMSYHIDYKNGRVIFDIYKAPDQIYGSGDVPVYAEFSYKRVFVTSDYELKRTIENIGDVSNNPIGSGVELLDESKIPLPTIVVQETSHDWRPYQLGGYKTCFHRIRISVFSGMGVDGENIIDILSQQENKKIPSIDWNKSESYFDGYGDINPAFSGIYEASSIYKWKDIYVRESSGFKDKQGVFAGRVSFVVESSPHM